MYLLSCRSSQLVIPYRCLFSSRRQLWIYNILQCQALQWLCWSEALKVAIDAGVLD